jgi:hypothetical protein
MSPPREGRPGGNTGTAHEPASRATGEDNRSRGTCSAPLVDKGRYAGLPQQDSRAYIDGLRRRRAGSYRLPVLDCGRSDPWHYDEPGERGYLEAAAHLLGHGLTPAPNPAGLSHMRRRGGPARYSAGVIAERWELAA